MKLWLNDEEAVVREDIVGIFDMDSATMEKSTKEFLQKGEKEKRLTVATEEIPVSFIVTVEREKKVYFTRNAPKVLARRLKTLGLK